MSVEGGYGGSISCPSKSVASTATHCAAWSEKRRALDLATDATDTNIVQANIRNIMDIIIIDGESFRSYLIFTFVSFSFASSSGRDYEEEEVEFTRVWRKR